MPKQASAVIRFTGTGRDGRVMKEDVRQGRPAAGTNAAKTAAAAPRRGLPPKTPREEARQDDPSAPRPSRSV